MWLRTVARLIPSFWAISLFCSPAATQRRISFSRSVSGGDFGRATGPGVVTGSQACWLPTLTLRAEALEGTRETARAVDRLEDVDQGEELGARSRDLENAHVQGLLLLGGTPQHDLEALHRLALPAHRDDRAVLVAEAIAEDVLAPEDVVAAAAQHLVGRTTQEPLRGPIPEDDVATDVSGQGRSLALGEHVQHLGILLPVPVAAFQDTSSHGFPLRLWLSKARADCRVSNTDKGLLRARPQRIPIISPLE